MNDPFITIARFQYSSETEIVKGRLEADGIQVFLSDNLTIDTRHKYRCEDCKTEFDLK